MRDWALRLSGSVFFAVSLVHLFRVLFQIPATVGTWEVPVWVSLLAFLVSFDLSLLMWASLDKPQKNT
jgi:hypothetical protein